MSGAAGGRRLHRWVRTQEKKMSGGSFDYAYCKVHQFADDLGLRLDEVNAVNEWGDKPNKVSEEAHAKLRSIERLTRHVAQLMREVEWLYSGDTGDESFMERVREIEGSNAMLRGVAPTQD